MQTDFTKGSVNKALFIFAIPMILGNILQHCYNLVDTWVVGKYIGSAALSAVGSAYSLITFINSVLIGMCMGCGSLFAYYRGRQDKSQFQNCLQTSFVLFSLMAVAISILVQIFTNPILILLQTPTELMPAMQSYTHIIFTGIVFVYLYNYYAFLLRAVGNSSTPLLFLALSSVLNIVLDILFVKECHWGIEGAAAATVISQVISGIGLMLYTYLVFPSLRFSGRAFRQGDKPVRQILQFGFASSAQQSIMNFGILMVQGIVNSFGVSVMAAFAAGVKIDTLAYMPAQEFGNAYSIFVSQNYGADQLGRIKKGTKSAFLCTCIFCIVISSLVCCCAGPLIGIFIQHSETEIIRIGIQYLRIEGAFYFLIGILFLWYAYFRGTNRPQISLYLTIISLGTRVILAYIASKFFGASGIWWSIPIGWVLADLAGLLFYRSKNAVRKS